MTAACETCGDLGFIPPAERMGETQDCPVCTACFSDDYGEVWANRPPAPVGAKQIDISIVGTRCVYLNNYRIAGGKQYISENLPSRQMDTTLAVVLSAFSESDILAALAERKAERDYLARYRAWKAAR